MRITSPTDSERHAFIDVAIETMQRAFQDTYVQRSLGNLATIYSGMIDSAIVPNIVDGVVQAPKDRESDALPIVAINRHEMVTMEPYYHTQTKLQRKWAIKVMAQWIPRHSEEEMLDMWDEIDAENLPSVGLEDMTLLKTTASSRVITSNTANQLFEKPPEGIGLVKKRPILMFGIDGTDTRFTPLIGHELEHVRQFVTRPLQFFSSQNQANMQSLRAELESANAASAFAAAMLQRGYQIPEKETPEGFAVVHAMIIDQTRKEYRKNLGLSGDPFEPSGGLFRELSRRGFGAMLHEAPDFEMVQRMIAENGSR